MLSPLADQPQPLSREFCRCCGQPGRLCKQRLYTRPPTGICRSFWESQPAAYSLDGQPCFVYSLMWHDFRIRTLHPPGTEFDLRSRNAMKELAPLADPDPHDFLFPWGQGGDESQ